MYIPGQRDEHPFTRCRAIGATAVLPVRPAALPGPPCSPHWGQKIAHQKSTPQKSSRTFNGIFQWTFSVFQHQFTFQWHAPKDCHLPSGLLPDLSSGCSSGVFKMGFRFCKIRRVIFRPDGGGDPRPLTYE